MALISTALMVFKFRGFIKILTKNWKVTLLIMALAIMGYYHWDRSRTITKQAATITHLTLEVAKCKGALSNQNAIIETVKQTGQQIIAEEKRKTAAIIAANKQKLQAAIDKLNNKPLAQTCEKAMLELLNEARGELRWVN